MKSLNILVVEDDGMVAELLGEMLAELGHKVCATEATQSGAVAAARLHKPDLMIVDVLLREGNGLDAVDAILHFQAIPYVFVSGDVMKVLTHRPGAIAILKPYTEAMLIAAMSRALNRASGQAVK